MIRNFVAALILIPLAIVIVLLAVANRQAVTLSLDPFLAEKPALAVTQPLFVLLLAALIAGVIVGGIAAWLRQGKWRRAARRAQAEVRALRAETDALEGAARGRRAWPRRQPAALHRLSAGPPAA